MRLVLRLDGQDIQEFVLYKTDLTIGRTESNDIVIDNRAVSGHHATVYRTSNGAELVDMKSTNGTLVNDQKIEHHHLQDGDIISIGKHQILFFTVPAFTAAGAETDTVTDNKGDATVMMSADFQQQLQQELSKNNTVTTTARDNNKKGFFQKIKEILGFS